MAVLTGIWVANNSAALGAGFSAIGGPVILKKMIINRMLKKRYLKKLVKYLTDNEEVDVILEVLKEKFVKLSYYDVLCMKERIKRAKKQFKKLDFLLASNKVITIVLTSLQEEDTFVELLEKYELIEDVIEMLMITRKVSNKKIKKIVYDNLTEILLDNSLDTLKKIVYYIESQKMVIMDCMGQDDVIGYLEVHLKKDDNKDNLLHILKKVNFDIERTFSVSVEKIEPVVNMNEIVTSLSMEVEEPKIVTKKQTISFGKKRRI